MKSQTFLIRCEYPDGDRIPTQEFVENIQEYFDANIMDGEKGRLVVKPVYMPKEEGAYKTSSRTPTISELSDFISLVRRMREAQAENRIIEMRVRYYEQNRDFIPDDVLVDHAMTLDKLINLEEEVDEYLKKFNENI